MYAATAIASSRTRISAAALAEVGVRVAAAALAASTAYLHSTLGGLLFTLNAIGFGTLAVALVVPLQPVLPGRVARPLRLLVRLGALGFAAATIGGWVAFGARYSTGYFATGIEAAIVVLMLVDIPLASGGPRSIVRELASLLPAPVRRALGR